MLSREDDMPSYITIEDIDKTLRELHKLKPKDRAKVLRGVSRSAFIQLTEIGNARTTNSQFTKINDARTRQTKEAISGLLNELIDTTVPSIVVGSGETSRLNTNEFKILAGEFGLEIATLDDKLTEEVISFISDKLNEMRDKEIENKEKIKESINNLLNEILQLNNDVLRNTDDKVKTRHRVAKTHVINANVYDNLSKMIGRDISSKKNKSKKVSTMKEWAEVMMHAYDMHDFATASIIKHALEENKIPLFEMKYSDNIIERINKLENESSMLPKRLFKDKYEKMMQENIPFIPYSFGTYKSYVDQYEQSKESNNNKIKEYEIAKKEYEASIIENEMRKETLDSESEIEKNNVELKKAHDEIDKINKEIIAQQKINANLDNEFLDTMRKLTNLLDQNKALSSSQDKHELIGPTFKILSKPVSEKISVEVNDSAAQFKSNELNDQFEKCIKNLKKYAKRHQSNSTVKNIINMLDKLPLEHHLPENDIIAIIAWYTEKNALLKNTYDEIIALQRKNADDVKDPAVSDLIKIAGKIIAYMANNMTDMADVLEKAYEEEIQSAKQLTNLKEKEMRISGQIGTRLHKGDAKEKEAPSKRPSIKRLQLPPSSGIPARGQSHSADNLRDSPKSAARSPVQKSPLQRSERKMNLREEVQAELESAKKVKGRKSSKSMILEKMTAESMRVTKTALDSPRNQRTASPRLDSSRSNSPRQLLESPKSKKETFKLRLGNLSNMGSNMFSSRKLKQMKSNSKRSLEDLLGTMHEQAQKSPRSTRALESPKVDRQKPTQSPMTLHGVSGEKSKKHRHREHKKGGTQIHGRPTKK